MKRHIQIQCSIALLFITTCVCAENGIYIKETKVSPDTVYTAVHKALEDERFWIVFEANIGENNKRFASKWDDVYNQNKLTAIRSMVVCNGWWANLVSNADPDMLALCPLRVTVTATQTSTRILFAKPTTFATHSPALDVIQKIEQTIINAIDKGVSDAEK